LLILVVDALVFVSPFLFWFLALIIYMNILEIISLDFGLKLKPVAQIRAANTTVLHRRQY